MEGKGKEEGRGGRRREGGRERGRGRSEKGGKEGWKVRGEGWKGRGRRKEERWWTLFGEIINTLTEYGVFTIRSPLSTSPEENSRNSK